MKSYIVDATVLDEVCIAERHSAGNEYIGLDYIPGTAWWGGMAALTGIRPGDPPSEDFRTVFYSGDVVFTNLYPTVYGIRSHPIPLSARTRKSAPGFKDDGGPLFLDEVDGRPESPPSEGVKDWLIDGIPSSFDAEIEGISGWYVGKAPSCKAIHTPMTLRGHHERSPRTGASREGNLFSRQNISRGAKFKGALRATTKRGENSLKWIVDKYIQALSLELSVGRQPGRLKIELTENLDDFLPWQIPDPAFPLEDDFISLTLLSDAIVPDKWLRPLRHVPGSEIKRACGKALSVTGPASHFSSLREILGWNGAYCRPRETEWAIAAGSAFVYEIKWDSKVEPDARKEILAAFQSRGIGLRRSEGYGEIRINDPFHWKWD